MRTNSLQKPALRLVIEEQTTVIRGSTWLDAPSSLKKLGLTSPMLTTYRLHLHWSKSQELWKLQSIRIRMLMPSHTWHWLDNWHLPIGMSMALTRNHNPNQWCDYCKARWGQIKTGEWHPKAKQPAVWVCISEAPHYRGRKRYYCYSCAMEVQTWASDKDDPTNTVFWSLKEQLEYAKGQGEFDINV